MVRLEIVFLKALVALVVLLGLPSFTRAAPAAAHLLSGDEKQDEVPFQVREDPGGRLTIAEVASAKGEQGFTDRLSPRSGPIGNIVLWARLRLMARPGAPGDFTLLVHALFPFWDRVELYTPDGQGGWGPPHVGGRALPLSARALHENRCGFRLAVPASPVALPIYLRLEKREPTIWSYLSLNLRVTAQPRDAYEKDREQLFLIQGIYLGVILIMIVYNLVLYLSAREASYLAYVFLLFSFAYYFGQVKGLLFELFYGSPLWLPLNNFGVIVSTMLLVASTTAFSALYLDLRTARPRLFVSLVMVAVFIELLLGVVFLSAWLRTYLLWINYLVMVVPVLVVISGVRRLRDGYRPAQTFMASSLVTLVLVIIQNLCYVRIIKNEFLTAYAMQGGTLILITFLSLGLADRMRIARRQAEEKEKSDRLLRNVLPPSICDRLKSGETTIAERYEQVTVLFADIVGFTELSVRLSPEQLVANLNLIFSRFDELTRRYGLEKIKTIGDCYMVVAGLPERRPDHAEVCATMAIEMQAGLESLKGELLFPDGTPVALRMRIGLHSGPVVAGIIGTQKYAYDLWGDTVNTASRMESHGIAGQIHCSEAVYCKLRDTFTFSEREEIVVKGKGRMRTYLLTGRISAG